MSSEGPSVQKDYDVFISYAREDENSAARPLADELRSRGFSVWLDRFVLDASSRVEAPILSGLQSCYCPVVILGHDFLRKEWPKKELDILLAIEEVDDRYRIVSIRHGISSSELSEKSHYLASRTKISTDAGMKNVCDHIIQTATDYALKGERSSGDIDEHIPIARFFDPGGLGKCKNKNCTWRLPKEAADMGLSDLGPEYTLVRKQQWYVACASCGMVAAGPVERSFAKWILTYVRMHLYAPERAGYLEGDPH